MSLRKIADKFKAVTDSAGLGSKMGISFLVILLACLLLWVGIFAGTNNAVERFNLTQTQALEGEIKNEGKEINFSCILPEAFEDEQSLLFKSSHAVVEVLLNGVVIYSFGTEKPVLGKSPGTCWHVVSIPEDSAGQELILRRTSVYSSYKGSDRELYYGSKGACILKLVDKFLFVLVMNSVSIVLGLICLLLFFKTLKKKEIQAQNGFLWIGLFAIIIAFWSLRQSGFLRFLIPYAEILYLIDIDLLFFAAVPLDMFVYTISKSHWGKSCIWFIPVYLFGIVFGTVMQAAMVFDIVQMLTVLHIFIGINAVYMFLAIHMEAWKKKGSAAGRFRIPLYTMLVFGIMEMVHYYMPSRSTSVFLPIGVTVFVLLLVWQQISAYFHLMEEQKLKYFEKFANTDMLTGALNRNAYETKLKELATAETGLQGYGAALFDLNGLKFINDHFGHEKGDDAIKRCYNLIMTAFGDGCNCYRIGGDEFVVLALNEQDMEGKVAHFNSLVAQDRQLVDFPFNVAFGYATFDAERDNDLQDTIKRSDAMMYLDKNEKKQTEQGGDSEDN